jgi:hypothetical protein
MGKSIKNTDELSLNVFKNRKKEIKKESQKRNYGKVSLNFKED